MERLPNVRFSRLVSDVRQIYKDAKIVLVPSQVDEAWGRVVSEAQCSGIPAVYWRSGGLPEAAGDAGICLEKTAPAGEWVNAINELWTNTETFNRLSATARATAEKFSMEKSKRLSELLSFSVFRERN